jgi:hypothetical protein
MCTCLQVSFCQIRQYKQLHHQPKPWPHLPNKTPAVPKRNGFSHRKPNMDKNNNKQFSEVKPTELLSRVTDAVRPAADEPFPEV